MFFRSCLLHTHDDVVRVFLRKNLVRTKKTIDVPQHLVQNTQRRCCAAALKP